jgi:hypothetical protein
MLTDVNVVTMSSRGRWNPDRGREPRGRGRGFQQTRGSFHSRSDQTEASESSQWRDSGRNGDQGKNSDPRAHL